MRSPALANRRVTTFIILLGLASLVGGSAVMLLAFAQAVALPPIPWELGALLVSLGGGLLWFALRLQANPNGSSVSPQNDTSSESKAHLKGLKAVAIGGGTGLPATLRGLKPYTDHITAVVTIADDGGSSGRLRRDLQILPPGDLRNNLVALADDESLLARLFQYRFTTGELKGHSFGNLFIAALADVVSTGDRQHNPLADALSEVQRVLNIRGRVLPASLTDARIIAELKLKGSERLVTVIGESKIESVDGQVERIRLEPSPVLAYPPVIDAILDANLIVIGPGSLYTSIIPNLLVTGIADAIRASNATKVYVCNVATQPVETEGYSVADHVMALENHVGRGVFQTILANNAMPQPNAGENTRYVTPIPDNHEIQQRYEVRYTDLADVQRPWRHDPQKLGAALLALLRHDGSR
ncbi:MAG: gluconeogenesis factor YvcK family protein [Anaerolineae bacterium]